MLESKLIGWKGKKKEEELSDICIKTVVGGKSRDQSTEMNVHAEIEIW